VFKIAFLEKKIILVSDFRRDVDEICALLGCYTASSGDSLPTFRDNVSVQSLLTFEYGTDAFSQNVGKRLPLDAA
jgi:hypothetical protein